MTSAPFTYQSEEITIHTSDGCALHTLIYHPDGATAVPTLLQGTCYGAKLMADMFGAWFADKGYRVVFQDCRGTDASSGELDYFAEAADGRTTADWIAAQSWFNGSMGTFGESYMGFTQYALASTNPPYLKAMAVAMCSAERSAFWYPGNSFAAETCLIYW